MANLVFPKAKPIGVNSASSREAIRDSAAFPTKVIDYLKFDIFDQKTNTLVPPSKGGGSIYLYLPTSLQETHSQNWDTVNLGPAGNAALNAAKEAGLGQIFFNPNSTSHQEEIDFCWRAFNHGYKTHLVSSSKIYHLSLIHI